MREATKEERESINNHIKNISQKAIIIPDNATNADVIKAIFNDKDYSIIEQRLCHTMWWNKLYERR